MDMDKFALYVTRCSLRAVTDNSIKLPRIDCAGDRWAWSHRYERWVVTDVNTDNETNAEKRFDPAYPGSTFVLKLDNVIALNNWCGPLRFAGMMFKRFMVAIGLMSPCCHASLFRPRGWDRVYCVQCGKRVR